MPLDRLLVRNPADPYPHGAAQAVLLAVQSVEDTDGLAGSLTGLVAVLSPAGARRDLVRGLGELDEHRGAISAADIDATIGRLAEASLLTFSVDDESVLMHRFTQRVLRERERRADTLRNQILLAAKLVTVRLPAYSKRWDQRALGRHLILHIDALWDLVEPEIIPSETVPDAAKAVLRLRAWSVSYLWSIQDARQAIQRGISIVADHERLLGDDCQETTDARYGLALAYGLQRLHNKAIPLNRQVVDWYATHYGVGDRSTSVLRNTLANNYRESGEDFNEPSRLNTAIALHEQNFVLSKQAMGIDHRETCRSGFNLANAYLAAGRAAEAVAFAARTAQQAIATLGVADDVTLSGRSVLARAHAADGDIVQALAEIEQCVEDSEAALGEDHPYTWLYRRCKSEILRSAGRLESALHELERVAAANTRLLGENNPSTLKTLELLAEAYKEAEQFPDASATYQKVLGICLQTIGADSPITRRVSDALADLKPPGTQPPARPKRRSRCNASSPTQ
jgi:tetratricopeptide (TPR) repeat protein